MVVGSYDVYVTSEGYIVPETQTKSVTNGATTSFSFTLIPLAVDEWSLTLTGRSTEPVPRTGFASLADPNRLTYTDASGTWSGHRPLAAARKGG